jgi:hypothetical protein
MLEFIGCILLLLAVFVALRFVSAGLGILVGKTLVSLRRWKAADTANGG